MCTVPYYKQVAWIVVLQPVDSLELARPSEQHAIPLQCISFIPSYCQPTLRTALHPSGTDLNTSSSSVLGGTIDTSRSILHQIHNSSMELFSYQRGPSGQYKTGALDYADAWSVLPQLSCFSGSPIRSHHPTNLATLREELHIIKCTTIKSLLSREMTS
jgi:hypothetical protein